MCLLLTRVSASTKTHFSYWVSLQQCNLVNVMPNSGLASRANFCSSFESRTLTSWTKENTASNVSLTQFKCYPYYFICKIIYFFNVIFQDQWKCGKIIDNNDFSDIKSLPIIIVVFIERGQDRYLIFAVTPGVIKQTRSCLVLTRRKECARTSTPRQ